MTENTAPQTLTWLPEHEALLEAFRQAQQQRDAFDLIDMLSLAALSLHQSDTPLSAQSVVDHTEQHVWPAVEREMLYQGSNTFDSYRSIIEMLAPEVIAALQTNEPGEALLRLANNPRPSA